MAFALLVVVVVVVVLLTRGSGSYRVAMVVPDAGQMVTGNLVKVGSASIGTVSKVRLAENGRAELVLSITDDAYKPLHRGTQAIIRNSSFEHRQPVRVARGRAAERCGDR